MFEILRKLLNNIISLIDKIKCQLSCCNSSVSIRIVEAPAKIEEKTV